MELEYLKKIASLMGKHVVERELVEREYEVTRISYRNKDALVFFKVKGLEDIVLFSNLLSTRKDVVSLLGVNSLEEAYSAIERAQQVLAGLERVSFEDHFIEVEPDFSKLPFLKFYREDGGYYLTSSVYIACYGSTCNASYHRTMYLSKNKTVLRIVPRHLHYLISKFFEKGRDAPVALVLGLDPYHEIATAMSPPLGVFEVEVGAALGGERRVIKTPKYGIPVPANASIVIEGVISRSETALEGPFVDMLMLVDKAREQPVFIAERMYVSRKRPLIVHAIVPGLWEHQLLMGFPREAHMYIELKRAVPCVKAVRLTEGGSTWLHGVVSVSKECSEGDARLAALVAISGHPSIKHLIVIDDDIDVDSPEHIEWAIATRVRGGSDVIVLKDIRGSTLEPRSREGIGDKVVVVAVTPRNEPYDKYKRAEIP